MSVIDPEQADFMVSSSVAPDPSNKMVEFRTQPIGALELPAPRTFFCNLEEALAIDKNRSQRRDARAFMPIRDQVLVFPCDKEEFSDTGAIVLPATAQEKQSEGIVIAAGRGHLDANNLFIMSEVQAGDRVLFGKYAGQEVTLRGKVCRLMLEREILGVIR